MKNYLSILKNIFGFHLIPILAGVGVIYILANDIGEVYVAKWIVYLVGVMFIMAGFVVMYNTIMKEKGVKEEDINNSVPYIIFFYIMMAMFATISWAIVWERHSDSKNFREFTGKIEVFDVGFMVGGTVVVIVLIIGIRNLMRRLIQAIK